MKNQHIARLESQLEQLIEGTFANLFGKHIRAHDVALQLARVMQENLRPAFGSDPRLVAPDVYHIYLQPQAHTKLLEQLPNLSQTLSGHLVELATQSGYRLNQDPQIKLLADAQLNQKELLVVSAHSDIDSHSTAVMQSVQAPPIIKPQNPQLIIDDDRIVSLEGDVINVGRQKDNHIAINDPYISRHHLQLRLRAGSYMLFDVHSSSGTYVNDVQVKEHKLRSGDVIRIGKARILYMHDDQPSGNDLDQTDAFEPFL